MRRDRIVPISDRVPRNIPFAADLGFFRSSDLNESWVDEARQVLAQGHRAVLAGDLETLLADIHALDHLCVEFPQGSLALSIHWSQALHTGIDSKSRAVFDTIYIIVDEAVSREDLNEIGQRWKPIWVFAPNEGLNWLEWVPKVLRPERRGSILLFPIHLSADELRLHLDEFALEHPLLSFEALPHEWYIPYSLGPWNRNTRDGASCLQFADHRTQENYDLSIVVPFRWTGMGTEIAHLKKSLASICETFPESNHREIIISVDHDSSATMFEADDLDLPLQNIAIVASERAETTEAESEWRAGYIRNCGADTRKNRNGLLLFVDADIAITNIPYVRKQILNDPPSVLQLNKGDGQPGFKHATSAFFAIKVELFKQLGGFSASFASYGCEDNFLIWLATKSNADIGILESSCVQHLREPTSHDEQVAKMMRLRLSADLIYKMTFDPEVHRHFYSSLGPNIWLRAALRRLTRHKLGRLLFGPLVFLMTLFESQNRSKYLLGFHEVLVWKLKRPLIWLKSNTWKASKISHFWKSHAWKIPNFFVSKIGEFKIATHRFWISASAHKFGWTAIGWRISVLNEWLKRQLFQIKNEFSWRYEVSRLRFSFFCKRIYDAYNWRIPVARERAQGRLFARRVAIQNAITVARIRFIGLIKRIFGWFRHGFGLFNGSVQKILGATWKFLGALWKVLDISGQTSRVIGWTWRVLGTIWKIFVIYVVVPTLFLVRRPYHFAKQNLWRVAKLKNDIAAEIWILNEPTAWFALRTPKFHRFVWHPMLKVKFFLEYHLISRWKKTS